MDFLQLSAPLKDYFFRVSTTRKYAMSILAILVIAISWYFFCYIPLTYYLSSKRLHLQHMRQKKAVLEKQLARLKKVATDLALAKKEIDVARERIPVVNKEYVQGIVEALCTKHALTSVKQQHINRDESYSALLGDIQVISYAYQLRGSYAHLIDFFEDLHTDHMIAFCCNKLYMKRSNDHLICNCIVDFIGKREP